MPHWLSISEHSHGLEISIISEGHLISTAWILHGALEIYNLVSCKLFTVSVLACTNILTANHIQRHHLTEPDAFANLLAMEGCFEAASMAVEAS